MSGEERINAFINNRYCVLVMAVVAVVASYVFFLLGMGYSAECRGICESVVFVSPFSEMVSWALGVAAVFLAAFLFALLNKHKIFIREYTLLHVGFFLFVTLTNPDFAGGFSLSMLVGIVVLLSMFVLFNGWQLRKRRVYVFTVSFFLSLCSMLDYVYLLYFVAFFFGFMQMRLMSLKALIAIVLGAFTPYWIGWGFGLFSIDELSLPAPDFSFANYAESIDATDIARVAISITAGIALGLSNAIKIISYRLQLRAYNAFFTVLSLLTILLMAVDIANFRTYLMVLNICIAVQVAHFFSIRKFLRRYVIFFLIIAAYLACSVVDVVKYISL